MLLLLWLRWTDYVMWLAEGTARALCDFLTMLCVRCAIAEQCLLRLVFLRRLGFRLKFLDQLVRCSASFWVLDQLSNYLFIDQFDTEGNFE